MSANEHCACVQSCPVLQCSVELVICSCLVCGRQRQ